MSINQLGRINFAALDNFDWQATDFETFQSYIEAYFKEIATANWGTGVAYGGLLSVSSGLVVAVTKLLASFSTGQLVTMDASTIPVGTADPTNPRIDRIELGFALTNNTNRNNAASVSVVFDKLVVATLYVNPGTPAGSPTAPATTAGRISLGTVTVNATQTLLTAASFDMSESARDIARKLSASENSASLSNNQSAFANIVGLKLSSAITRRATIKGYVYLVTASNEALYDVTLECRSKPVAGTWTCDATIDGPDVSTFPGLEFTIQNTGQVQYKTPNIAGSGYAGLFKWNFAPIS